MIDIAHTTRRCLLSCMLAACLAAPALAEDSRSESLEAAALERVEQRLNAIRTLKADFRQYTSQGGRARGTVILQRPGKMKIAYAPPAQLEIYADGTWLIYVDRELKEVNQLPISMTPADVLLRENLDLQKDVKVEKMERRKDGWLLHLRHKDDPDAGRLVLSFGAPQLDLRGWIVTDPQGVTTTVALENPEINQPIPNREFIFDRPGWAVAPEQD